VEGAPRWQAAFARDWGVHFVGANGSFGVGTGGGIFDPHGRALGAESNALVMATIEVPR
jgi:hypothetical protein